MLERLAAVQEPHLLEKLLTQLEQLLGQENAETGPLSDQARAQLKAGMASTQAGRTFPAAEADRLIAEAIQKAQRGV